MSKRPVILALRKKGLSQVEIARKVGVTKQYVSKVCKGLPRPRTQAAEPPSHQVGGKRRLRRLDTATTAKAIPILENRENWSWPEVVTEFEANDLDLRGASIYKCLAVARFQYDRSIRRWVRIPEAESKETCPGR